MSCEAYQRKIGEALAGGEPALSGEIVGHLRVCGACRDFYESQQQLLAAIDSGVRAMVNETVPALLLPSVRARMKEARVARFPFAWKVPAVAVIVLVMLIVFPLLRNSFGIKGTLPALIAEGQSRDAKSERWMPAQPAESDTPVVQPRRAPVHFTARPSAQVSARPEEGAIIVNPAEARGLLRLAEAVKEDPEWAVAMTRRMELPASEQEPIQPIQIPDLEMKPLSLESE